MIWKFHLSLFLLFVSCALCVQAHAQDLPVAQSPAVRSSDAAQTRPSLDYVIDHAIEREHAFALEMRKLHPVLETYLQNLVNSKESNAPVPGSDVYFLGMLDVNGGMKETLFAPHGRISPPMQVVRKLSDLYHMKYLPLGFAQMLVVDNDFQRKNYDFKEVDGEFLGEVRCRVFDVMPKEHSGQGPFLGRIWVEDRNYNIVRFKGTYAPPPRNGYYLHFDSWRFNVRDSAWLPEYVYSEESNLKQSYGQPLHFKAQTRFWGYTANQGVRKSEYTDIHIEPDQHVEDQSRVGQDASPIEAQQLWQHQAEVNVIDRLTRIGLLAPEGEVDGTLLKVINNLMPPNAQPAVKCRVLMTTPLESFTIGNTIVVSRGLVDVLPDEASLAAVLSHELAHILLGHRINTDLAFNDRLYFPDEQTFERLTFAHGAREEAAADKKAAELLNHSIYKDSLASAELFLKAVRAHSSELKSLIRPHLGNSLMNGGVLRMATVIAGSTQLDPMQPDQIAALPLGGRIKVDPWTDNLELQKMKPTNYGPGAEKMSFEVTPFYPFLRRAPESDANGSPTAAQNSGSD